MERKTSKLDELRIDRPHEPGARPWGWVVLVVILAMAAVLFWWWRTPKAVPVQTVLARAITGSEPNRTVLNASGYVTPRRAATVSSKVTAKVVEVLVEEGVRVEGGQILARLDDTNVRASLNLALARHAASTNLLEETRVRIREAERELRRQEGLLRQQIARQADFDTAEAQFQALQARLHQQQAEVYVFEKEIASWQQQMEDTIIRAPFSGVVTSKNAQPGEMISPISAGGGFTRTGICTIVDMESLEIEIDVNESFINRVEPHQAVEATLDAYPDWKIPCKVIAIVPTADRQKSTVKVRVGFDALEKRILPEMGVKVAFRQVAARDAAPGTGRTVVIPRAATQRVEGRDIVYLVRDGKAERRAITLGAASGDDCNVVAGLAENDRLVVNWPAGLTDGTAVRLKTP